MNFIDRQNDRWQSAGEEAAAPTPYSLLTAAQWEQTRSNWPDGMAVGVLLANDANVETLAPDLPRLALIVLEFPKWTDGRAYSQAHLLRSRHRWPGEIRAVGEVLVDMVPLLQRNGFDSALLRADQSIDAAERALTFFPAHYQGDVRGNPPLFARSTPSGTQGRST